MTIITYIELTNIIQKQYNISETKKIPSTSGNSNYYYSYFTDYLTEAGKSFLPDSNAEYTKKQMLLKHPNRFSIYEHKYFDTKKIIK